MSLTDRIAETLKELIDSSIEEHLQESEHFADLIKDEVSVQVKDSLEEQLKDLEIETDNIQGLERQIENAIDCAPIDPDNIDGLGRWIGESIEEFLLDNEKGQKLLAAGFDHFLGTEPFEKALDKAVGKALGRLLTGLLNLPNVAPPPDPVQQTLARVNNPPPPDYGPPASFNSEGGFAGPN